MRNIFVLTLLAAFLLCAPMQRVYAQAGQSFSTIVIDAGHGGKDPGTVYGSVLEKDITLGVALQLGKMIREQMPGVKVVYTRDKDVAVALKQRGEIANKAKADLFLSIHVNATDKHVQSPSGALTLVMGTENTDANFDMATRENKVIVFEDDYTTTYKDYLSGSSEMFVMYKMQQYVNINRSIDFADLLQKNYKTATAMPDRGVRGQKLLVLWYTTMPGVLTEIGFIDNEHDRKYITGAKGQKALAASIFASVKEYKELVEGRGKPAAGQGSAGAGSAETSTGTSAGTATGTAAGSASSSKGTAAATTTPASKTTTATPGVVYRIQILSATKKIPERSSELKEYKGRAHETFDGTRYRYYVEECRTYANAMEMQAKVRASFSGAFVVAFDGGKQIPVTDARRMTD